VEKADQLMDFIIRHFEETNDTLAISFAKAIQVEMALKKKNIDKALLLNEQQDLYDLMPPLWYVYVPQLTPVKLKLAINTTESVTEALKLLTEIEKPLRQTNKKTILTDVLILKALAFKAQKKEKEALGILKESIKLSLPGRLIRPFIEAGLEIKDLLEKLLNDEKDSIYIKEILKHFKSQVETKPSLIQNKKNGNLLEPLTDRELEILTLLSKGLKNREIGDKIFLASTTVKKHIYNIYQKLNVHSRIEVVTRARESGLLL
jgi:LuxR family maltose regulon positive regulatory protein